MPRRRRGDLPAPSPPPKRRRTAQQPPPPRRLWLHQLPTEVLDKIARNLSNGEASEHALNLALTSPTLARAVTASLSNTLDLCRTRSGNRPLSPQDLQWASLFRPHIVALSLYDTSSRRMHPVIRELFESPTLKWVFIQAHYGPLRAVESALAVRELVLFIDKRTSLPLLCRVLRVMKLERLVLFCGVQWKDSGKECVFTQAAKETKPHLSLSDACTQVPSMQITCGCVGSEGAMWKFVKGCQGVRQLNVGRIPPLDLVNTVQHVEDIKFQHATGGAVQNVVESVVALGDAVTELTVWSLRRPWTVRQVEELAVCRRLKEVRLDLGRGADAVLAKTVKLWEGLEKMSLAWRLDEDDEDYNTWVRERTVEATPGSVLATVKAAPMLKELELDGVKMDFSEVKDVLEETGKRLEVFSMEVVKQREGALERLESLLRTVRVYNPELTDLDVGAEHIYTAAGGEASRRVKEQLLRIQGLLKELKMCSKIGNLAEIRESVDACLARRRPSGRRRVRLRHLLRMSGLD